MKHILLTTLICIGLSVGLNAKTYDQRNDKQIMSKKEIKRMDSRLNKHRAVKRNFRTQKEFRYRSHRNVSKHFNKYDNGRKYTRGIDRAQYNANKQHGYAHSKRGWTLAYRYDRASFYDNHGYYYGYFNHNGYYFEDVFYRYDRYYTYKDRVRGRGLFDYSYYIPEKYRYYGFSRSRH